MLLVQRAEELPTPDRALLRMVGRAFSDAQIAREFCRSRWTVRDRLGRLERRLGVHGRTRLVLAAVHLRLVQPSEVLCQNTDGLPATRARRAAPGR